MAIYTEQCSAVGSFGYAGNFKLYVVLNDKNGNANTNKSYVDYNVYCQSDGSGSISARHYKYFSINGEEKINTTESINASSPNAYIAIASGTIEVAHNADGTKVIPFSAEIQAASFGVSASISGNFTLNTIPRASSISISVASIESAPTYIISSASSKFRHTIQVKFGDINVTIATNKAGGSYSDWIIPKSFYSKIPNATSGTGTITCITYNNGTEVGRKTNTFKTTTNSELCKPNIDGTIVDTNSTTIALTGDKNKLIRYKSTALITLTSISAKNSATIKSKSVNGKGISDKTLTINNVETGTFNLVAVDSRGYSITKTISKTLINYINLTANVNFSRPQPTTGEISLEFSGNYFNGSFGATNNSLSIEWYWKESTETSYTKGGTITPTISGNTYKSNGKISLGKTYNYQKAYDFYLLVKDKLVTLKAMAKVSVGLPAFAWGKNFVDFYVNTNFKKSSGETCYYAQRTDSNVEVGFGVGAGGINHGIFSRKLNKWLIHGDASNVYLNGYNMNRFLRGEANISDFNSFNTQNSVGSYNSDTTNKPNGLADWGTLINLCGNGLAYKQQLAVGNFNMGGYRVAIRSYVNKVATPWEYLELKSTVLYDNAAGTAGTISLSESKNNFTYLKIFSDAGTKMIKASDNETWISEVRYTDTIYQYYTQLKLSDKTISRGVSGSYYSEKHHTENRLIYRVLGYR